MGKTLRIRLRYLLIIMLLLAGAVGYLIHPAEGEGVCECRCKQLVRERNYYKLHMEQAIQAYYLRERNLSLGG